MENNSHPQKWYVKSDFFLIELRLFNYFTHIIANTFVLSKQLVHGVIFAANKPVPF